MKSSFNLKLGSLREMDVRVDSSVVFLVFYVLTVTVARFPAIVAQAGLDPVFIRFGEAFWSLIFAFSMFLSVALHEIGSAFLLRAFGAKVKSVTLTMLGGVTALEEGTHSPKTDLKASFLGPAISLVLAGLSYSLYSYTESPALFFFSYWLGMANAALAIVNLLPAFPLDGGQLARSFFSRHLGYLKGTRITVRMSKVFAIAFGIFGFLQFNFLAMAIGFFIFVTAQQELHFLVTRGLLKGMRIREVATRLTPLSEEQTLKSAAMEMMRTGTAALPVATSAIYDAVVTLAKIKSFPRSNWEMSRVKDIMIDTPRTLDSDEFVGKTLSDLAAAPEGTLPVTENGDIVGIVRLSDLSDLLQLDSLDESPIALSKDEEDGRTAA